MGCPLDPLSGPVSPELLEQLADHHGLSTCVIQLDAHAATHARFKLVERLMRKLMEKGVGVELDVELGGRGATRR